MNTINSNKIKVLEGLRKAILVRVPVIKAKEYEIAARNEGFGTLSAWVISALNKEAENVNRKKPPL